MRAVLATFAALAASLALAPGTLAAPLAGSQYDTGDGDQQSAGALDWQGAAAAGLVRESPDANDDCFVGGVKELNPNQWAFNHTAGGCTPGKSNLRVAFANPESAASTTFGHFSFFRNDTTGNSFLTFELNQTSTTWVNSTGTTIPCRANGDLLLSYEVGGSSLTTSVYKWVGDGSGPPSCPNGASGTFIGSGTLPAGRFQGAMNASAAITNFMSPGTYGASFPANSFGEGAIDLPAVLQAMGQSACFGFVQMQVHSRSSSSISSAMIDYTTPVPVYLQSCAATGVAFQDTDGDGQRDAGEPGLAGFEMYADLNHNGSRDAGEPTGTSDATGFYRILNVPAGTQDIREVSRSGWTCTQPSPCFYSRAFVTGGNSTGNDFGHSGPSTASGVEFDDLDGDGVRDAGEPGRAGWTVYADLDGDGTLDAGEPSGVSDSTGAWTIDTIPSGTYTIRDVQQTGWTCSAPSPCMHTRSFTSNSSATNVDFGGWAAASVSGNVFEDVDGDGAAREAGDASLSGWQVYADANGNDAFDLGEPQTTSNASGDYTLSGLTPGATSIRVTAPAGTWYCTRPGSSAAACEHALTLTSGLAASGRDFGLTRTATVSGTKFDDANNNGLHDSAEGGLAGFTFFVDYDNDNALDAGEPSGTSVTGGTWSISGVKAGSWTLREQPNGAYACTKPSPCTYALSLASNATASGYEFGNYTSRSVSGTLFEDADADGLNREAGEAGLSGWTVYSDANNNSVKDAGEPTSITNSLGQYNLTGLANGSYRIRIVSQSGWTCSYPSGCLNQGSIGSGQSDANMNFGVWGPSTISGTVFEDLDADGATRESGEAGLSGRVVYVDSNGNSAKDSGEPSATTDASGAYSIIGVNPGTYTVRQVLPGGWTCSRPSPCSYSVTGSASGRDFGSYTSGSIAGNAYEDADADGAAREAGEAALSGRSVYLDANGNGAKDSGEASTTTDASGNYSFAALAPATYSVRQVLPAGWIQSAPAAAHSATVASRAALSSRDFASYTTGSVSGRVFDDADFDNSAYEAGDALLSGRVVYVDVDDDGSLGGSEPQAVTNGSGAFTVTGLPPGTYTLRTVSPAGRACGYPSGCSYSVTVASQSALSGRDFGSYVGATVSGHLFEDLDADGAPQEGGEPPLAGRRVYLDGNGDGTRQTSEPTTLTDAGGDYSFTGIVAQSWQVRLDDAAGWTCDSPSPCRYDLTLTSGSSHTGKSFGLHAPGTVAGHLYTDRDDDGGPQVFGENDQPERTVYLDMDDDGTHDAGEPETTTDDRGNYAFSGLEPGAYHVRQVLPPGWNCSTPNPCMRTVALESRDNATGQDFSSWTTASFSGTWFEDLDADGDYQEPGEPGVSGKTVYIDANGNGALDGGEPTAVTGSGGAFSFSGLAPGSYTVRPASLATGWSCSYPVLCSYALTLEAGEAAQDVNFGTWTTGTVSGTVYDDEDEDGARGGSEAGLSGWTVFADLDGDGVADAGEPSTTSGGSGDWSLVLDPGTYTIREVRPTGWACTAPTPCEHAFSVVSSGTSTAADFGNAASPAQVSGVVFDDADADGAARETGESARAGRTVYVDLDGDGNFDAGEPNDVTAADGSYSILGLTPGATRTVRVDEAAGRTCSLPSPCSYSITPAVGDDLTGRDFGSWAPATVSGTWWNDLDGDGQTGEPGETGRGGETVYADLDGDGVRGAGEPSATTGSDGSFSFPGLTPGTYTVRLELPAGQTCSTPCSRTITVSSGETVADADFGTFAGARVSGTVIEDADGDGTLDGGETGRSGVTVYLDADGDGQRDPGERSTTTAADGSYELATFPGAFTVRLDLAGGWTCSAPAGCSRSGTASSGDDLTGRDFGVYTTGSIAGTVREDGNADGDGDTALSGRTVYIDADRNGALDAGEPSAVTDSSGDYSFPGLAPGSYRVRTVLPAGWTCSSPSPCAHDVTLASGDTATARDFAAWQPATVSGTWWNDLDGDGQVGEPGETGRGGETVYVELGGARPRDPGDPTAVTAADGSFSFAGLTPGTYTIAIVVPAGQACSTPCARSITVGSGGAVTGVDFGTVSAGHILGTVREDSDADGVGDVPLEAPTVYVDVDGDGHRGLGEPAATTVPGGGYDVSAPPGSFTVRVDLAVGWTCSAPTPCSHDVTVTSGQSVTGNDFALYGPAAISGTVRDDGGASLAGRTIYLDVDGDGGLDAGEPSATTDASGDYSFGSLKPGSYSVRMVLPSGWECSAPSPCVHAVTLASRGDASGRDFVARLVPVPPPPDPDPVPPPDPDPVPPPPDAQPPVADPPATDPPAVKPTSLSGTLFEDHDADGLARELGEQPLASWQVWIDLDGDGIPDPSEPSTTSDAEGHYSFNAIPAGDLQVRIVAPSARWVCSLPSDCVRHVHLDPEGSASGQDFAAWRKAKVTGYKFEDADGDGSDMERGDKPLAGWIVYVDLNGNGRRDEGEPYDVTDENGRYGITNIPLGSSVLRESAPEGSPYRCTYPAGGCSTPLTLLSGDESAKADFGSAVGPVRKPPARISHRVRLSAPAGCQNGRFRLRVRAQHARRVVLSVDGRRRAAKRTSSARHGRDYAFRLNARRFGVGVHRVRARVTFADGRTRSARATFYRCRAVTPRYTG